MLETGADSVARNTYFDRRVGKTTAKLLPGEYYVTREDMVIATVLGSCVSACIRDVTCGIGGMNHFMLPDSGADPRMGGAARYGVHAMEMLINGLLKLGARREHFEAKVFGGGNVMRSLSPTNVGRRNSEFVLEFLGNEQIRVTAHDLEDVYPRKVHYFPATGTVRVRKLMEMHNDTLYAREADYGSRLATEGRGGDIELFG
jgi:chemotaxis protein CheD